MVVQGGRDGLFAEVRDGFSRRACEATHSIGLFGSLKLAYFIEVEALQKCRCLACQETACGCAELRYVREGRPFA